MLPVYTMSNIGDMWWCNYSWTFRKCRGCDRGDALRFGIKSDFRWSHRRHDHSSHAWSCRMTLRICFWLVGQGHPSEKYEFVNWDDDIPNIWENKIHGNQTTNQCLVDTSKKSPMRCGHGSPASCRILEIAPVEQGLNASLKAQLTEAKFELRHREEATWRQRKKRGDMWVKRCHNITNGNQWDFSMWVKGCVWSKTIPPQIWITMFYRIL